MDARKIIALQIVPEDERFYQAQYVVCDDGTAWFRHWKEGQYTEWEQIPAPRVEVLDVF